MAVNRFVLNGISYHGKGAIQEIPGIVSAKGVKKAFIASDPDLVKFGITKKSHRPAGRQRHALLRLLRHQAQPHH